MKNALLMLLFVVGLAACGGGKENRGTTTNVLEKVLEAKSGQEVDLPNVNNLDKSEARVSFNVGEKQVQTTADKLTVGVIATKEKNELQIYFQITSESGRSFMAGLTHVPENFTLPLRGVFAISNAYDGKNPTATLMAMSLTENGAENFGMPFEGTLTITELTLEKVVFNVEAKGGDPADTEKPENWKPITMNAELKFPITQTIGTTKEQIFKR
jgi:hypothetical protein